MLIVVECLKIHLSQIFIQEEFLKASNYFYRISQVVKTDWLSSYYYAFCNTRISMLKDDKELKEEYLDKAFDILEPFNEQLVVELYSK